MRIEVRTSRLSSVEDAEMEPVLGSSEGWEFGIGKSTLIDGVWSKVGVSVLEMRSLDHCFLKRKVVVWNSRLAGFIDPVVYIMQY